MPQYSVLLRYSFYGTIMDYKDHTAMAVKNFGFIENYRNSVIRFFFIKNVFYTRVFI